MSEPNDEPTITIAEDGPYLVSGSLPLLEQAIGIDAEGNAWEWVQGETLETRPNYALCRCGQSSMKPFCDGTHRRVGFDGTETASREAYADRAEIVVGPTMDLADAPDLCAFARFCDGHGTIWNKVEETDSPQTRELVAHQAAHCPSGRLVVTDKEAGGDAASVEPSDEPSIVLVEDPQEEVSGPLYVRGGVPVVSSDGSEWERRNRVALCRCGASENKPFCDGTHAKIDFQAKPAAE